VRITAGDFPCGPSDIPDLVRQVSRGGVADQPLDMPVQESGELRDVPDRHLKSALLGDQARPG
jgi:hypothetical protein